MWATGKAVFFLSNAFGAVCLSVRTPRRLPHTHPPLALNGGKTENGRGQGQLRGVGLRHYLLGGVFFFNKKCLRVLTFSSRVLSLCESWEEMGSA